MFVSLVEHPLSSSDAVCFLNSGHEPPCRATLHILRWYICPSGRLGRYLRRGYPPRPHILPRRIQLYRIPLRGREFRRGGRFPFEPDLDQPRMVGFRARTTRLVSVPSFCNLCGVAFDMECSSAGRFFASNLLKSMLAHLVVTYDIKFENEGVRPRNFQYGELLLPHPTANVMFRKRQTV
jgi:hypothetical protein